VNLEGLSPLLLRAQPPAVHNLRLRWLSRNSLKVIMSARKCHLPTDRLKLTSCLSSNWGLIDIRPTTQTESGRFVLQSNNGNPMSSLRLPVRFCAPTCIPLVNCPAIRIGSFAKKNSNRPVQEP
jgi:hypothetical protein